MRIPLPTDYTVYRFLVPSLGVEKKFRPFTVKENKALLTAQSVDDHDVMMDTLKLIIGNCCLEEIDVDQLALFDAEYLLIKLRSISIGKESSLILMCPDSHDGHPEQTRQNEVFVDLDNIEIVGLDKYKTSVRLSDSMMVEMNPPTLDLIKKLQQVPSDATYEQRYDIAITNIRHLMKAIVTEDEVIKVNECGVQDIREWLESLTEDSFELLHSQIQNIPYCRIKLDWVCPFCGKRNVRYLEGLSYFFY